MTRKLTFLILAMMFAVLGPGAKAWGQVTASVELCTSWNETLAYATEYTHDYTIDDLNGSTTTMTLGVKGVFRQGAANTYFQMNKKPGYFKNTTKLPGKITKIETTWSVAKGPITCYFATNAEASSSDKTVIVTAATSVTYTPPTDADYYFFNIDVSTGSGSAQMTSCKVYYEGSGGDNPSITVNPTSIDLGTVNIDEEASATFTVSQANLTNDITLSAENGDLDTESIVASAGGTEVTYTITPSAPGAIEDVITISCEDLEEDIIINVTGTAIVPPQVTTYEKVTSADDLVAGASYILVCPTKNKAAGAMGANAYFSSEDATLSDNNTATSQNAIELVLGGTTGAWTFTTSEGLIGTTEAKKLNHNGNGTTTWTISISGTTGEATITSTATEYGSIKYNASAPRFLNYASGQTAVALYKKAENKAATPTLTESQIFTTKPFEVTITNNEAGATVYYTTNGDNPTTETTTNFTGASTTININATTTVKAMAAVEGKANSEIASATYTEQKNDPENQWSAETYTATIGGENTFPTFITQSNGAKTYTSSNTNAATIDATGTITLVAAGTTTITASTAETATYMAGEASYTLTVKEAPLTTMDAIFAKATTVGSTATEVEVTFNNWVISGVKGSNAYLTDNAGKGLIIYTSDHGFAVGDVLNGTIACQIKLYSGASELMGVTSETSGLTVTKNGEITIHEVSIADLSGVNTGAVIKVNNVQYNGTNLVDENSNIIKPYNAVDYNPTFTNGLKYNVTGVYIQFNTTKEIAPRSAADIQLIVAAPTFTPEGGDYNAAQNVEIASATAGAAIYYTLDGSDPTVESTLYSAPIELTSNTTLKAIAAKAGSVSEIATAVYTITITTVATPTFDPEGGSYFNESLEVSLDCATDGATIVYTTDNWATQTTYSDPFTITETTTVKAKATKADMDDSGIAEATYTKRYKVNFVVNGDGSAVSPSYITPEEAIGTLPTATAPNGYTFRGWNAGDVALTDVEPTYIAAETIPTGDMTLKAVFAIAIGGGTTSVTKDIIAEAGLSESVTLNADNNPYRMGELPITLTGIKGTSNFPALNYNATKGTDLRFYRGTTCGVTFATTNNSTITKIEFKKNAETASNLGTSFSANVGTLSDNVWTGSANSVTISYNKTENFNEQMYIINVTYSETAPSTYSNFCTTVNALYGNLAEAATYANTAYYISDESNVPANKTATINGVLGNADASLLIINDRGQLIHHNAGVAATVKKNITGYTGDNDNYYLIANPTDNTTVANLINPEGYDLYTFDPTQALEWNYEKESNTLTSGIGYLYANSATTTLEFVGALTPAGSTNPLLEFYNGTDSGRDFPGFNLIGNPYACNAYVEGYNFYRMVDGELQAAGTRATIAPCEGFFVEATTTDQSVSLSTEVPEAPASTLSLSVNQNRGNVIDRAIVNFNGSNNLHKFMMNPAHTNLSIAKGGETFAAISTEAEGELPMNFKAEKNGSYTITVDTENVDAEYLHLIDNMTGMDVDLLSTPSYTFDAKTSDYASRFKLVFGVKNEASESSDSNFAFMSNGNLVIDNIEGEATLQIVDELGRVISTETVSGSYNKALNLKAGLYIINLNGMTQKIVVK